MGVLLFLVGLVVADVYSTGIGVAANVIIESRAESLCTYQVDPDTNQLTDSGCFLDDRDFAVAVATDADEDLIFFSDILTGTLFQVRTGQDPQQVLYGLGSIEGIAVDWLAENVFWTDFDLGHICVSRYDGKRRTIITDDDVLNPRGVAVDPFDGLIFWSDLRGLSDFEGRVERCYMDGTGRVAIVDDNLISPSGLVIDFNAKRVYFTDRGTDTIESVTYDGQDRKVIYQQNGADFFDITIHGDYLFATIWRSSEADGQVMAIGYKGANAGEVNQTLDHRGRALGITTMDEAYQPEELNGSRGACGDLNGGCDHLCLPIGTTRQRCACATGYSLADDGITCETDHTTDHFLLVADSSLNAIYQVDASTDTHDISALPLDDLDFPVALAYDHVDGMVYWTDRVRSAIGRATLDGTVQDSVLFGNIADPGGLALDTRRRLAYWTDEERNEIGMAGMDDNHTRRVFIDQDLDQPRAIAVNLVNGDVYWTDWGAVAKIERVSSDGSNRQVLVEGDLVWPNCLAIDPHDGIMYWCDAYHDRIETSDLDGNDRRTLVSFSEQAHPFSIAIYGDFIYWTDWLKHRLSRANRWTGEGMDVGRDELLRMQGLAAYEFLDIDEEVTTVSAEISTSTDDMTEASSAETPEPSSAETPEPPPPMTGTLNVTLIAAAGGGGLTLLLVIIVVTCCIVKCARSKGGRSRGPDDHVPMSVRSTSFVGSYDPNGLPGPSHFNNNPPPLPPAREKSDPIYQDIDDCQKSKGGEAAYQAYLNPAFRGDGGDEKSPRYVKRITPQTQTSQQSMPKKAAPAPPKKPKAGSRKARAPARPDETYMTPDVPKEQNYVDVSVEVP